MSEENEIITESIFGKSRLPPHLDVDSDDESIEEYTVKEEDIEIVVKHKQNRAEYMKEYYAKNKTEIIKKICSKEVCQYCNRTVGHQNLIKHQKSKYCKTRRDLKKQIENE